MATSQQITCIRKGPAHHDAHTRIQGIGGASGLARWFTPEVTAIREITAGLYSYHVVVGGKPVAVVIADHKGRRYLKTTTDDYAPNNLLSLPECP